MTREEVSQFLLTMYRGSQEQPIESFRQWALEQLSQTIPFDWVCWRHGTVEENVCWLHVTLIYRISRNKSKALEAGDVFPREATIKRPGQHLSIARVIPNDLGHCRPPGTDVDDYKNRNHEPDQVARSDDKESLPYIAICLYLENPRASFTNEESQDAAILGPHLIEAWLLKLFLHQQNNPTPFKTSCERALCDTKGTLWCAPPQFIESLRTEWPQWRGRTLPAELIKATSKSDNKPIFDGEHVRCMASPGPTADLVYLHIQKLPPLSVLPPRQRKIAMELAQGKTYNQIAHSLGISRSTVTNHANAIYSKLGISNKVQLALLCFGHTLQSLIM